MGAVPEALRSPTASRYGHAKAAHSVAQPWHAWGVRSLRVALLGAPVIEVDGEPLDVDTRKATALLAYLAVSGHTHPRALIAELLWPDADGERSRSALRRTLSTLRTALGDGRLRSDRLNVGLDMGGVFFDLAESRRLAANPDAGIEELTAAAALHRGDLLAGFALRDTVVFDDWQRETQELTRRERAALLDRLANALAGAGRLDAAVVAAGERLALDPLHEPTHRLLIDLYARAGRRGDALEQYRRCVRVLDAELGVGPLRETTELYDAISGGGAPAPVASEPASGVVELALVGRATEFRRLLDAHDEGATLVLIEGESGVGKTRLAHEALEAIAARGAGVLRARAHAGEQALAYGVVAQLLRAAGDDGEGSLRSELARVLPELGAPPAGSLEEPGARLRFLEAVAHTLVPADVVFVDDLQWCDPASLDALAYLAHRLADEPLVLLGARRTDEPDPEHRYARLATLGERVVLGRLAREDVVGLALGAGLDEQAGEAVFRESEGLPLFVAELLSGGAGAPGGARALVEARLDAVGGAAAQVLGAAALIGRTFDADTLRLASGRSEEEVAEALDELAARGLIVERDDAYDFGHERLRAIAEDRVGLARRRLLHRRIGEALGVRHADPAIVARHLELAGDDRQAAHAHAAAGERARLLSATAEAIGHFESAIALGHPEQATLHEAIGDLETLHGAYPLALAAYAAAGAHGSGEDAGALEHKIGAVHERRGEWDLAEGHYLEALALGAAAAEVQADRSRVAWRRGESERARELGVEALALAQDTGATAAAAAANNLLGMLGAGRVHLERALELARELPDPGIAIAALNNLARDDFAAGELGRAEALLREALELCVVQGDLHHEAALRNNLADVLHHSGRTEESMAELKRAVSGFAAIGGEGEERYPGIWSLVEW
jgi:DNA-binding SARP family transcriptional activator